MSVFFIKIGFVAVGAEQDILHPVGRPSHLFTDDLQVDSGIAFDNQFIMNMPDDKTMAKSFHSVAENVTADGLDDILHEFRWYYVKKKYKLKVNFFHNIYYVNRLVSPSHLDSPCTFFQIRSVQDIHNDYVSLLYYKRFLYTEISIYMRGCN